MSADLLTDAWGAYRDAVRSYYEEIAQPALEDDRILLEVGAADRALQDVVECSETLTEIGEAQLRLSQGADDRIALRLLAAGAVDVAVACETLRICPDRPAADPVFAAEGIRAPEQTALELLNEADELFGGGGVTPRGPGSQSGGGPKFPVDDLEVSIDVARPEYRGMEAGGGGQASIAGGSIGLVHSELMTTASQSLDALIGDAVNPGLKFASGLFLGMGGGIHLAAMGEPLRRLHVLAERVGVIKRRLVRLLASGFQKLVSTCAAQSNQLIGRAVAAGEGIAKDLAQDFVEGRFSNLFGGVLGWLVRRDDAAREAETLIGQAEALDADGALAVKRSLEELTDSYHDEMAWAGKTANWLSWASPFISTLAVHVGGPLLVAGLNAAGFGFVIYTLDVRVDGHGLPARVRSVVRILNDELAGLS